MAQFLPRRWRRQPAGPLRINWGHPLAAGLKYYFDLRDLRSIGAAEGRLTIVAGTKQRAFAH